MQYITGDSPLRMLGLSGRSYNAVINIGIDTVAKLLETPIDEILKAPNLGLISTTEIRNTIDDIRNGKNGILFIACGDERIDQQEVESKTSNLFYDFDGILRKDIPIKDLDLSVRAYRCLSKSRIRYASEIINLTEEDLSSIRNMGAKTVREILDKVQSINFEAEVAIDPSYSDNKSNTSEISVDAGTVDPTYSDNKSNTHEITKAFEAEIKKHINIHSGSLRMAINQAIETYVGEHDFEVNRTVQDYLNDQHLIRLIYSQDFIQNAIKNHIILVLQKELYGFSFAAFEAQLPNHLIGTDILAEILDEMQTSGNILFTEHGVERRYPTASEYARNVTNERAQTFLIGRLNGETLGELGQKHNLTRERVRQVVLKQMKKRPRLMEDRYIEVFKKYYFEKQDFMIAFDESELTYNYLDLEYSRGSTPIEALMEDTDFPLRFRKAAEKAVYKDYITVDGERIKLTKSDIAYYVLKTYFKDEGSFEDFLSIYTTFLQENNLDNNDKFLLDKGTYLNKLSDAEYVLWKKNKRLRYYDIAGYDFDELQQTLAFDQYSDIEYSTLKFFRDYPGLMRTYDIRDEYELHNLLKKLYKDAEDSNINFGRMPTIEFGTADRDTQILELLLQYAPVLLNDLADAYEKEYGVRSSTVKANYLKNFDEYFYNGMYTIDADPLPAEDSKRLIAALTHDFYSIADIKRIYLREVPGSDASHINPLTIKALGFRVFSSYAVRNTYLSAAEYFRKVLTDPDIVDLREIPKAMLQSISFTAELMVLKSQYEIVEFSPSKCINFRRLDSVGITKDHLQDFCHAVYSTTERGSYFTIHSLQKNGFSHLLDNLGFEEWFYSSILSQDSTRFSYQRMGKTRVFVNGKREVLLKDFVESLVSERQSIDIYDLIELMEDDYGVTIDKQKIMGLVNSSAMYYNSIMETVYIDYDTYFEEV